MTGRLDGLAVAENKDNKFLQAARLETAWAVCFVCLVVSAIFVE